MAAGDLANPEDAVLKDAWFLMSHDLKYLLGRRETLLWTFVMPIIFFYFIGSATGAYGRRDGPDPINVTVPSDAGFLADEVVKRLEQRGYQVVHDQDNGRGIQIPAGFTASVLAGKPVTIEFVRNGAGIGADYDGTRISRAVNTVLADFVALASKGPAPTADAFAALAKEPHNITVDVTTAGKRKQPPIGFQQATPGIMVMFTLLVLFTSGSVSILVERRQGILRRLASSPISRGAVTLGKWGARFTLGMVQIVFGMITGTVLFKVQWGEYLWAVLLMLAAYAAMAAALGLLLGNFARSEGQVIGFGVIATNLMAALGGCWWPIEITPRWTQSLALVFPTGWAMDGLHKLMSFGDAPAVVLPHIAAFLGTAAIAGYIAARKFRFE
jgi:ABC-2 type transport system permease protein